MVIFCLRNNLNFNFSFKTFIKTTKIKPKVFENIFIYWSSIFLIVTVGFFILTENYGRLWNVVFVLIIIILQKVMPKLTNLLRKCEQLQVAIYMLAPI